MSQKDQQGGSQKVDSETCVHEWSMGVCTACGKVCDHPDTTYQDFDGEALQSEPQACLQCVWSLVG